jgi:asparagine synthase (glutamine-hydrolysing)
MTGICGWLRRPTSVRPDAPIAALADSLFGTVPTRYLALGARAMLGGRLGAAGLAVDAQIGAAAAIEGKPRWNDASLAAIAAERGDARALLEAFARDRRGFLRSLSGTFALAVADDRSGELVLAVDRMGIRPLCYALNSAGDCVFGSSASAVVAAGQVDTAFAPQSLYNYVYFHVIPSPATVYASVRKLEPGQLCRYADGKISTEYYWTPDVAPDRAADPRALQAALMSEMRAAVARTAPDAGTGAFLSGGLDSSTVCGLANERVHPLRSFTIGFSDERYNETEYARAAAEQFGLDLREYYVTPDDIADAFELVATSYDEPFGNSSALPAYFCALRAKEAGVTRMLAGDGGDELFAGNERYATQQLFEYYHRVPLALRKSGAESLLLALPSWTKLTHKARRYVEQARVPMPERLQTYNYLHMQSPRDVFDASFLANVDTRHPVEQMNRWYGRHQDANFVDRMLRFDWKLTLADNDVRKVNRMCSVAGVEVDYPLLDDSLVDFSLRIPGPMKMENRELRSFYKQAVTGFLPSKIIHKKKHGFGLPFGVWLATSPRLQEIVASSMASLRGRGFMLPAAIDELLRAHRMDHGAYYGNIIWVLTALEAWLKAHEARAAKRAA